MQLASALDSARSPTLRIVLARSPWLRSCVQSRSRRLVALTALGLFTATVSAVFAPAFMFVWGPLLLGVPHLLADVRYLAFPQYAQCVLRWRDLGVVAVLAATLVWPRPEIGWAAVVWAATCAVPPPTRAGWIRYGLVLFTTIAVYAVVWKFPIWFSYAFVHAHNVIGILLFVAIFARARMHRVARWTLGVSVVTVVTLIGVGAFDMVQRRDALLPLAWWVLPQEALEVLSPAAWQRVVVAFVFMQGVHYVVWLRLIPEAVRKRDGLRGYQASLAALRAEFGPWVVAGVACVGAVLLAYGFWRAWDARLWYLRLAGFHAYFELVFVVRWLQIRRTDALQARYRGHRERGACDGHATAGA